MSLHAAAGMDLTATVDNPGPAIGDRITYTVTLSSTGSLPDITPPDFDGFDVVMGPSVSTSVQIVNMAVSKSKILTYVLRPNRAGALTIGPARVQQKGRLITSNPVTVQVLQSSRPPPVGGGGSSRGGRTPAEPPSGGGDRLPEVFLAASADKSSLYKLDMAVITYRLYLRVNVLNYEIAKTPQATGFWIEEFLTSTRPVLEDVTVRGQPYKAAVVRKIGVFPTRPGSLILDPLTLDVTVDRPVARRRSRDPLDNFFDDPFFSSRSQREVKSVTCDPLTLNVRDFPAGAPSDFRGDVGEFQIKVSYDKSELPQNDALTVKVTISGRGYLKSVDAPKLSLPSGFEQFAPTADDNITVTGEAMRGRKTFTYLVIPRRTGNFTLPQVPFSYFDPDAGTYRTISDGGLALMVSPATGGDESVAAGRSPSEVTLLDSDIRFVKSLSGPLMRVATPPYRSPLFFVLLGLAPLAFLGGIGWEKFSEKRLADPVAVRRRRAPEVMRKALIEADRLAKQGEGLKAVEAAGRGLAELVGAIIREPSAGLTSEVVGANLAALTSDAALIEETVRLLGEADRIRFGGAGQSARDAQEWVEKFRKAAEGLEKVG